MSDRAIAGRHTDTSPIGSTELLQVQLERMDTEIITLVRRRTALARQLGEARRTSGGTRVVHEAELAVVRRFLGLGAGGRDLAMILLRLGRWY